MQPLQLSPRYSEALPMYYRLQQTLIDKIICQDWKAGMQLPSEREIAATMGISVGTVRKALENMVHKDAALKFADWLVGDEAQTIIRDFGKDKYGQPLFFPNSDQWNAKHGK